MGQQFSDNFPTKNQAAKAAAGFHADSVTFEKVSDFEFLFTRAIEFRQETVYFIIVDRFHDGDPSNNEGPNKELYDPTRQKWGKYWGGDLQGIIDKLDYLKNMGVTAIWVSPLFEQVEALQFDNAAMHGYWTKDFKRINSRFLAQSEENSLFNCTVFDRLISGLHDRGMKLILDIVCNHSSPDVNGEKGKLYDDGVLIADFYNDINNWYYHNPEITDWENQEQLLYYEMAGLATFNESNPQYRHYIKTAIKQWLDRGVDALRVDTVKHMPIWFWQEFNSDIQSHKPSVFTFGEWGFSNPKDGSSTKFTNESGMSILDFGLSGAIREALAQKLPGGFQLIQNVFDLDYLYNTATELITFIDNHDMPRFLSLNPDHDILRLAIILVMTCRGIPCIYYGTEQYLYNNTNAGNDPYNRPMMEKWDTETQLYQNIQLLSKLRRLNPAVSLGSQIQKYITDDVYCYLRRYRDSRCFVAMNKGQSITIDVENTELEDGEYNCILTKRFFEVILDVVFNHTAEGNEHGPTISFRGIDNKTYYMLTPEGYYYNFSGTGNTLNCNNPIVRGIVLDCLRYWASEYHIDGFRFDLAAILGRDPWGAPLANPPLLESLAFDPILAKCKLIAEAWDAGGLYQVGSFPAYGRWAEWNGKYRDGIRKFLKGDGTVGDAAQRLQGSPDLYAWSGRAPATSINFITAHDGFTMMDLFSYNGKHNEANGENNNDGTNDNDSWNCGWEGTTDDPGINALRRRQIKNALAILMVSQGVPMILMGDEVGRTQYGNNNTYCHDNDLNWLDWKLLETNADLFKFFKHCIAFRNLHPVLRNLWHFQNRDYVGSGYADITWHGTRAWNADWSDSTRTLAFMLCGKHAKQGTVEDNYIYVAMNMHWETLWFEIPGLPVGMNWHIFANTGATTPHDSWEPGTEPVLENQSGLLLGDRSLVILVGK